MGPKTQERELDNQAWSVSQFPASEGFEVLQQLGMLAGPTVARGIGALKGGAGGLVDADMDFAAVGGAIEGLFARLGEPGTLKLVKRMLKDVRCDGQEVLPQFDLLFMGRYATLFRVLAFVVEVNYRDFFDSLAGLYRAGASKLGGLLGSPKSSAPT